MSFVIKGKKGIKPAPLDVDQLLVGSRSLNELSVDDPTVAAKHCVFNRTAGGFQVEDLGSSTGTIMNGVAVQGRAEIPKAGATIVIGHSRLTASIDEEGTTLTLALKEGAFFYDKKNDPLTWVRSEVRFGRWRGLRVANWCCAGLCLLIVAFVVASGGAPGLMEPGLLLVKHQADIDKKGLEDGCAACHDPYGGTPVERCEDCHQRKMADGTRYPYWSAAEWEQHGRGCQECHLDHQGAHAAAWPEPDAWRRIWGGLTGRDQGTDSSKIPSRPLPLVFDTFSHAHHLEKKVACGACHVRTEKPVQDRNGIWRDFGRVRFETCMGCHDPKAPVEDSKVKFQVAWHGSDDPASRCTVCHDDKHVAALKKVRREVAPRPGRLFSVPPRDHEKQVRAISERHPPVPAGRLCSDCHKSGRFAQATRRLPFRHHLHLSPDPQAALQNCRDCHQEVLDDEHLAAGAPAVPPDESCKQCHEAALPRRTGETQRAPREAADFPHKLHLASRHPALKAGCYACHEVQPGEGDAFDSVVTTRPEAANCTACHTDHANVGMLPGSLHAEQDRGSCVRCHLPGDPAWYGPKGPPQDAGPQAKIRPITRPWPKGGAFAHFGGGHEASVLKDCGICHSGLDAAKTLAATPIPSEDQQVCRDCHRDRVFHLR